MYNIPYVECEMAYISRSDPQLPHAHARFTYEGDDLCLHRAGHTKKICSSPKSPDLVTCVDDRMITLYTWTLAHACRVIAGLD